MPAFLKFIDATRRVKSVESLFEIFIDTMRSLGFDLINFSVFSAHDIEKPHLGFGKINTHPVEWQERYISRNFRRIDPVARCATSTFRPFYWSELERIMPLTAGQRRFLKEAREAGFHNGVGIPFRGPMCQVAGISLATSQPEIKDLPCLDLLVAYCNQFYEVFRSFAAPKPTPPKPTTLSDRERQVLEGIAKSLTDSEIADLLGVKPSTIDSHLRHIFEKLMVKNRTSAVVTAIKLGLIDP